MSTHDQGLNLYNTLNKIQKMYNAGSIFISNNKSPMTMTASGG